MTVQQGHIVTGQAGPWSVPVRRRAAATRRSRSVAGSRRLSFRLAVAVALEAVVLAGVVQLSIGLGYEGQAGALPEPAPIPSYAATPVDEAPPAGFAVQPGSPEVQPIPRPLEAPQPLP